MASVTRFLDPDSSCQSQFIAYLLLSFVSSLIRLDFGHLGGVTGHLE
jgi:hypothetical protein